MGNIDQTQGAYGSIKQDVERIVKEEMVSFAQVMKTEYDQKLQGIEDSIRSLRTSPNSEDEQLNNWKKAFEKELTAAFVKLENLTKAIESLQEETNNKVDNSLQDVDYVKKDIRNMERSINIVEREAKLQNVNWSIEFKQLKKAVDSKSDALDLQIEAEASKTYDLHKECQNLRTALFKWLKEVENRVVAHDNHMEALKETEDDLRSEIASSYATLREELDAMRSEVTECLSKKSSDILARAKSCTIFEAEVTSNLFQFKDDAVAVLLKLRKDFEGLEAKMGELVTSEHFMDMQMNPLRSDWRKVQASWESSYENMQTEIAQLRNDCKKFSENHEMKASRTDFLDHKFSEGVRNTNALIKVLYTYFSSGVCYFEDRFPGMEGTYEMLIYPKIKRNYTKRVPHWSSRRLKRPFNVVIGNQHFVVTEYHIMIYGNKISDIFFIVPEIFEDFYTLMGSNYFQKFPQDIKITTNKLSMAGFQFDLYAYFKE